MDNRRASNDIELGNVEKDKRTAEESSKGTEEAGDDHNADEGEHGGGHKHKPNWTVYRHHEWGKSRPVCCYIGLCGAFCFCLFLLIILLSAGVEVIKFTTEFPFYILGDEARQRQDGVYQTHQKATYEFTAAGSTGERSSMDGNIVHILYVKDGSNLLTPKHLRKIRDFENKLLSKADWENEMCLLAGPEGNKKCVRPTSPYYYYATESQVGDTTLTYFPREYDDYPTYANTKKYKDSYYFNPLADGFPLDVDADDAESKVDDTSTFWARYNSEKLNELPYLSYFDTNACERQQEKCAVARDFRNGTCTDEFFNGTLIPMEVNDHVEYVANCQEAVDYVISLGLNCDDKLSIFGDSNTGRHYCCETCFHRWYPQDMVAANCSIDTLGGEYTSAELLEICLDNNKGEWSSTTVYEFTPTEASTVDENIVLAAVNSTLYDEGIIHDSITVTKENQVNNGVVNSVHYTWVVKYPWSTKQEQGDTLFDDDNYKIAFNAALAAEDNQASVTYATTKAGHGKVSVPGKTEVFTFDIEAPPFYDVVDGNFGVSADLNQAIRAEAVKSMLFMGLPIKGYDSPGDDNIDQVEELGKFCYENWQDIFDDGVDDMTVYWQCDWMDAHFTNAKLYTDMLMLMGTCVFIFFYMVYASGSFFLGCNGMFMIFMNFMPSILLYSLIFQQSFFGILQVMSLFLILSIGADDVFVLLDTWGQTNCEHWKKRDPWERLSYSLRHAASVMLTTSLSTIFSFIANTTSQIPAIWTFGLFCAILIFVNYCAVCLFYPSVLIVHELYFAGEGKTEHVPCVGWCCNCGCRFEGVTLEQRYSEYQKDDVLKEKIPKVGVLRPIDEWFGKSFYYQVHRLRIPIIFIGCAVFCIFLAFAAQLKPDPEPPNIYPEGHNYGVFWDRFTEYFTRATSDRNVIAWLAIGLLPNGIDRDGADSTDPYDLGEPKYDPEFVFVTGEAMNFLTAMCDDIETGRRYGDLEDRWVSETLPGGEPALMCPFKNLRNWIWSNDPNANYEINGAINPGTKTFVEDAWKACIEAEGKGFHVPNTWPIHGFWNNMLRFVDWFGDEIPSSTYGYVQGQTNGDYFDENFWAEEEKWEPAQAGDCPVPLDITPRLAQINVRLSALSDTPHEDGMELYKNWDKWVDHWMNGDVGRESKYQPDTDHCASLNSINECNDANRGIPTGEFIGTGGCVWVEQTCEVAEVDYPGKPPREVSSIYVTDSGYFSYYFLQDALLNECITGIIIALVLAFVILNIATGNYIMATVATVVITMIVVMIMGFTVMLGWRLGILESIIYVMVVGMSVDYVVHLGESYLESKYEDRHSRARDMLEIRGFSVMSGAISTLGGIFFLFFTFIVFFFKFAVVIFFLIFTSLTYSLIFFTAIMDSVGPTGEFGEWSHIIEDMKKVYAKEMTCGDCLHRCCVPHDSKHFDDLQELETLNPETESERLMER